MTNKALLKPGSRISGALKKFGIKASQGCSCYKLAKEMNRVGAEVVLANLEDYTNRMYESIKEWKKDQNGFTVVVVQPPKSVIKKFIEWACA